MSRSEVLASVGCVRENFRRGTITEKDHDKQIRELYAMFEIVKNETEPKRIDILV